MDHQAPLLLTWSLLLLTTLASSCDRYISTVEYESLYSIYKSAGGEFWIYESPTNEWNFVNASSLTEQDLTDPCTLWEGVTCEKNVDPNAPSPCVVSELNLDGNGLVGILSPAVGNLTALSSLAVTNNNELVGTIPTELGFLKRVGTIDLSYNSLTGAIPSEIGVLDGLRSLILSSNGLTGQIPSELGNIREIFEFELNYNSLTGAIPASFVNWKEVSNFDLSNNLLSENLKILPELKGCIMFTMDSNYFHGHFPGNWTDLSGMIEFTFSNNLLTGTLPESVFTSNGAQNFWFNNNDLSGTLPSALSKLSTVADLDLSYNHFTGGLPSDLRFLSSLYSLSFNNNLITGTIPLDFMEFPFISVLSVASNLLTGGLPTVYGSLIKAYETLSFNNNLLTGRIPSELANAGEITELVISFNYLTGSLSSTFVPVQYELSHNLFSGVIPDSLVKADNSLLIFLANSNEFTGSLPAEFLSGKTLMELDLSSNRLVGSLGIIDSSSLDAINLCCNQLTGPLVISTASGLRLQEFVVSNNSLSGALPPQLFQLNAFSSVSSAAMDNNLFSGTIPSISPHSLGSYFLSTVILSFNRLTGSIPLSLIQLSSLKTLDVGNNLLSGDMTLVNASDPIAGGVFDSIINDGSSGPVVAPLSSFYLGFNYFYGSFDYLSVFANITTFSAEMNLLSGSLEPLYSMCYLQQLIVFGNFLTGTLPTFLSHLPNLQSILIQNNSLVGRVTGIFNADVQSLLTAVDLSSNDFTGPIPSEVFRLPLIESFASIKTCLSGSLPEAELCNATTLKYLLMDGATAGTHCQRKFSILKSSDAYVSTNGPMRGGIPACLWQLPSLEVLHLSSNGLSGTIAAPPASSALREVVLSYNQLSGTIPDSLQALPFSNLNLANNRLKGTYQGVMNNTAAQLSLQNNRLSGFMSSSFQEATNIQVMQGNLFDCDNNNPKPPNDPNSAETYCGSTQLDISLIVMGGAAVVSMGLFACLFLLWKRRLAPELIPTKEQVQLKEAGLVLSRFLDWLQSALLFRPRKALLLRPRNKLISMPLITQDMLLNWNALNSATKPLELGYVLRGLLLSLQASALIVAIILFALLPIYLVLKLAFNDTCSTHTFQYQWLGSAAFLTGVPPAIIMICVWGGICTAGVVMIYRNFPFDMQTRDISEVLGKSSSTLSAEEARADVLRGYKRVALVTLALLLNIGVMFAANYGYLIVNLSTDYSSLVKTIAQISISILKFVWDVIVIPVCTILIRRATGDLDHSSDKYPILKFLCYMFNLLIIPGVVTAIVDSNCFLDLFVPDQVVVEAFTYSLASFHPCVTLPSVVINGTAQGIRITLPSTQVCLSYGTPQQLTTLFNPPFSYSYQCSSSILTSYVPVLIYNYTFQALFVPLSFAFLFYSFLTRKGPNVEGNLKFAVDCLDPVLLGFVAPLTTSKTGEALLGASTVVAILLQSLLILLTFGLASPPLAAIILVVVLTEVGRYFLLVECYLRFNPRCRPEADSEQALEGDGEINQNGIGVESSQFVVSRDAGGLNDACRDVWRATGICFWIAFFVSSAFWGLMVFDMVGNTSANSPLEAIWAPALVVSIPYLILAGFYTMRRLGSSCCEPQLKEIEDVKAAKMYSSKDVHLHAEDEDCIDHENNSTDDIYRETDVVNILHHVDNGPVIAPQEARESLVELSRTRSSLNSSFD